jgi:hypothetical protein
MSRLGRTTVYHVVSSRMNVTILKRTIRLRRRRHQASFPPQCLSLKRVLVREFGSSLGQAEATVNDFHVGDGA